MWLQRDRNNSSHFSLKQFYLLKMVDEIAIIMQNSLYVELNLGRIVQ